MIDINPFILLSEYSMLRNRLQHIFRFIQNIIYNKKAQVLVVIDVRLQTLAFSKFSFLLFYDDDIFVHVKYYIIKYISTLIYRFLNTSYGNR